VAFLYQGRLVAVDTPAALKQGLRHESVLVECQDGAVERLEREVAGWPGVGGARAAGGVLHVTVEDAASFVPRLFQSGSEGIRAVRIEQSSLEDAYFQLVGASLGAPRLESLGYANEGRGASAREQGPTQAGGTQ
jgi:ABC-2 type transport system ATP-binding protein